MSSGMRMGGGTGGAMGWRRQDASVVDRKLAKGTLRRILRFAKPFKLHITFFLLLVVVSAVLVIASPLLFKKIVDDGIIKGNGGLVTSLALVVALLAVIEAALGLMQRWFSARIGEGLIYDLRTQVFAHVQRMPIAFFTRTQTGALVSRLNTDVIGAQQAFTSTLSGVVSNVISLILVVGAMLLLSWQLTVVAILLLPVFLLPARYLGRRLAAMTREQMQLNADMSTAMTERFSVGGALLVTLFGKPELENARFSVQSGRVRDLGIRIAMLGRVFFTALTLVAALATALVYGVGGNLAVRETLTVGTLLALVALLGRLYGPLTALSNVRVDVMTALVSFERVFEVLDLKPMIQDAPDARPLPDNAASVSFDKVSFAYPTADQVSLASLESVAVLDKRASAQVIEDISFEVEPGQMVALVGPSGAGKTTITNLVARLYDVTGGSVKIGGHDVREVTLQSLHDTIGYVTQDAHMFHDTIRSNLAYAKPGATDEEMVEALRSAQVWELVSSLPDGLDTVVGDRGHRLSGGERQRLAIARLLLKAPHVVVLDEATAHLDSESEVAVQQALDTALEGRTSLVIAHRLSTVRNADQILVVDHGNIVERGTHDELLALDGEYADLYHTQFAQSGSAAGV
ncbi:ABC transporter ATP-binding protein [Kribbella sp. CA-293567]|uniref:ABC transporter ATP-binding protein n=1 Tax=Kribbella sp. CA-293567 TaxID=3002436 RepID=UPI0022DE375F|nr:ABC transporter ATP-binding protein [Kribbella sp. CA-293567]WBQ01823.1 ABC transporter ATP-binding protein [Kribbella sp. CA-293567]